MIPLKSRISSDKPQYAPIAVWFAIGAFILLQISFLAERFHPLENFFALILLASLSFICFKHERSPEKPFWRTRLFPVAIFSVLISEFLRQHFPDSLFQELFRNIVGFPAVLTTGILLFLIIQKPRKIFLRSVFGIVIILTVYFRDPGSPLIVFVYILGQFPFRWSRIPAHPQRIRTGVVALGFLSAHYLLIAPGPGRLISSGWALIPAGLYSTSYNLILSCAWILLFTSVFSFFKPRKIRTRLRWGFLLNFLIPTTLILSMSFVSVLLLIGGYQAATAKRLIFDIGTQAREQAKKLWESSRGLSQQVPEQPAFHRVGALKFTDGAIQDWNNPPDILIEKLEFNNANDMEFLVVPDPEWQLWIAGYYRSPDGSGAAIAYRIDRKLLKYISKIIGLDIRLIPGLNLAFPLGMLHTGSSPDATSIIDTSKELSSKSFQFPIGAILINSLGEKEAASDQIALHPYATIEVIASRKTLSESLIKTGLIQKLFINISSGRNIYVQSDHKITSAELQSINIINLIVFFLLSVCAGLLAGLISLSLLSSFLINRKINKGLEALRYGTFRLQKGKLDYRIPVITEDELGDLTRNFNRMADALSQSQIEKEKLLIARLKQERMEKELDTARMIQKSLLPAGSPDHALLDIAGLCRPALEVGGDYYDYFFFRDGSLGVAIGDVSGHGMSAGLLMSMAKSCLLNQVNLSNEIAEVIKAMNFMVCNAMKQKMLMTFLYGSIAADAREFTFASAGHHFPYIYRAADKSLMEIESIAYPLGVRHEMHPAIKSVRLFPDDIVILYTDGIIEAQSPDGELFGFPRFEKSIRENATLDVQQMLTNILAHVDQFKNTAQNLDDMTLVLIKIRKTRKVYTS